MREKLDEIFQRTWSEVLSDIKFIGKKFFDMDVEDGGSFLLEIFFDFINHMVMGFFIVWFPQFIVRFSSKRYFFSDDEKGLYDVVLLLVALVMCICGFGFLMVAFGFWGIYFFIVIGFINIAYYAYTRYMRNVEKEVE